MPDNITIRVLERPLHGGRLSRRLYGGFIELLDDLAPGMWAEMLNDRAFAGVTPRSRWCYISGEPGMCDREWEPGPAWRLSSGDAFAGTQCARLESAAGRPARLEQSGLAVKGGSSYRFTGYFRSGAPGLSLGVELWTQMPDDSRNVLACAALPSPGSEWTKLVTELHAPGTSDRVSFSLSVSGSGALWADKLSLMPDDNVCGWRRDVVEAVRDWHPGVIRWGGSLVDPGGYRWKDGIGDRDRRVPFPNEYWGRIDPNDVGVDEFLQFCEAVDAEPVVCLGFKDGVENARDLVEYCVGDPGTRWGARRAANGHPEPYGVTMWQIGNELAGDSYSCGVPDFCRAIREVQPGAVLLASHPTAGLLREAGQDLDIVCPHHYTPDLAACETSIDEALKVIREAGLSHRVKLGITEWNVTAGSWGLGRLRLLTLDCALSAARYLNLLHRRSDAVVLACRSNMANSLGSGQIQTSPSGLVKTPGHLTLTLYARHALPVPVAVSDVPDGLDVSACRSDDSRSACVFAVNTKVEPVQVRLELDGFPASMSLSASEWMGDREQLGQSDIMNQVLAPERVAIQPLDTSGPILTLPPLSVAAITFAASPLSGPDPVS